MASHARIYQHENAIRAADAVACAALMEVNRECEYTGAGCYKQNPDVWLAVADAARLAAGRLEALACKIDSAVLNPE